MWIDLADAIKIYARMCRARFGRAGPRIILARAEELRRRGDLEGADVFKQVARELCALDGRGGTVVATGGPTGQTGTSDATRMGDATLREEGQTQATTTREHTPAS
jgi:hypothetical protein